MASLREFFRRPVAWGAVILSYVGIFAGFFFAIYTYDQAQSGIRLEAQRARAELAAKSAASDRTVVRTGRLAIKSSCDFDNKRSIELRHILTRSLRSQSTLLKTHSIDPKLARHNIKITREDLREISFRDCKAAANVLSANPKG